MFQGKKWLITRISGLMVGLVFLAYWLNRLDPMEILDRLLDIKWWAVPLLVNSFLWYLLYTSAWRKYFSNLEHKIAFRHLLRIKICGEAVNLMTPIGFVAGDPVRALLLARQMGPGTRFGSVIVDRVLHSLATACFTLSGIVLVSFVSEIIPRGFRWTLLAVYIVILCFLGFFVVELVRGNGFKIFHPLLIATGLAKRFPKLDGHLFDLNEELSGFAGGRSWPLAEAFCFHFMGRMLGAVEISIIFTYLDGHPHFLLAVILATLTSALNFVFAFVPGALGILESFYAAFFYYYGLNPAVGVSMQLIRRLRSLFWILSGLFLLNRSKMPAKKT